jgi:hypothetical protein
MVLALALAQACEYLCSTSWFSRRITGSMSSWGVIIIALRVTRTIHQYLTLSFPLTLYTPLTVSDSIVHSVRVSGVNVISVPTAIRPYQLNSLTHSLTLQRTSQIHKPTTIPQLIHPVQHIVILTF